ncbi:hypothetical protein V5O48_017366 [Marasmius crinis-equi]|uniref:Nephrocystin 3-like N-terminal domain-containing protein n=1 Tax=Marasmius crinis-equi TaxID=585013 RepID=A0ABR3EP53_9AGAR
MASESLRRIIYDRIEADPCLLHCSLTEQFQKLVAEPMAQWTTRTLANPPAAPKNPVLVVIDGLDQCSDSDWEVLPGILHTITSHGSQLCLRLLVCSRPEPWIREAFDRFRIMKRMDLSSETPQASIDIKKFYREKFGELTSPGCPPWLTPENLNCLVVKSDGNFTYAETVVSFVGRKDTDPAVQLVNLLGKITGNTLPQSPLEDQHQSTFGRLDDLYSFVGSAIQGSEKLASVLAAIFLLPPRVPPSPETIGMVLGLEVGEIDSILQFMHSVLYIRGRDQAIRAHHKFFADFLFNGDWSKETSINRREQEQFLVRRWLDALIRISQGDESGSPQFCDYLSRIYRENIA